jgi:hypothetical protein
MLEQRIALNIAPADIDQLAASLQHKLTRGRTTIALPPSS